MAMLKQVRIGAAHISEAKRKRETCCPIALAMRAKLGGVWEVGVFKWGMHNLAVRVDGGRIALGRLSEPTIDFMIAFDSGAKVESFTMDIELHECPHPPTQIEKEKLLGAMNPKPKTRAKEWQ